MAHYSTQIAMRGATHPDWLRIGAQVGRLVNTWSYRSDLVVFVGEETISKAPAAFNPKSAEIEVDYKQCFPMVSPADIGNLEERINQLEFPAGTGAIYHEACHARFSRWDLAKASKDLGNLEFEACTLLEESRIEAWGVRTEPNNRVFLQASCMDIVLADTKLENLANAWGAAKLAGLTLARVDAGVLMEDDVVAIREVVESILGAELIAELRKIWIEFQAHELHEYPSRLYELATKWVELVKEKAEERGEEIQGEGEGEQIVVISKGGEQGDSQSQGASNEEILEAIKEAMENNSISVITEANDQSYQEEQKQEAQERDSFAKQAAEQKKLADKIFNKITGGADTGEAVDTGKSNSRLVERRMPTSEERASAVKLARQLEKAKYRNRNVVEFNSAIPGGKLRSRAMVQQAALNSRGIKQQVETWRHSKRKQTEKPDLNVAVMVDISGSMGDAMQPMATTAWVMSEAVRRIQGKVGMVYYGEGVFATLKPGQHLKQVEVYTAVDNTERFTQAFKAVDGKMNLTHGAGARLVVIVSDGYYQYEERANAKQLLTNAVNNGVGVLWLQMARGYNSAEGYMSGTGVKVVTLPVDASSASVAELIGKYAVEALEHAGKKVSA